MEDMDAMNEEELRAALSAKDEMVKELEQKMKDLISESESSMMEKEDKEEKMTEDEEKETKMAHTPDHEEKKEEEKENKMSETLNQSTLLSEVQALRENNNKLAQRLETIEAEKLAVEKREAVNTLLNEGKIQPSEVEVAGKAYELRNLQGEFWSMFSERPSNSAVPLVEVGHGASGQEISKASLDQEVRKLATEKSVSYSEALNLFRESNRDYYNSVFGG